MTRLLIGIDDTDAGESVGTGAVARELALYLVRTLGARSGGVTRHQLLVHPAIPYTSHNSSACIELEAGDGDGDGPDGRIAEACRRFLELLFHEGADPGLCVAPAAAFGEPLRQFGRRAQVDIVREADALALAREAGVLLEPRGGSGLGVIGALAACALRAGGEDGRFLALDGIRSMPELVTVAELRRRSPIAAVLDEEGRLVGDECLIATRHWVRPDVRGGRPVLTVRRDGAGYAVERGKRGENE